MATGVGVTATVAAAAAAEYGDRGWGSDSGVVGGRDAC